MVRSNMKVPLFEDDADKENYLTQLMMERGFANKLQSTLVEMVRVGDLLYVNYDRAVFQTAFTVEGEAQVRKKYDLTSDEEVRDMIADYYSLALSYIYTSALSESYLEHYPLFETAARFKETLKSVMDWIPEAEWEDSVLLGTMPDLYSVLHMLIKLVIYPKILVVSDLVWWKYTPITDELMLDLVKILKPKEIDILEPSVQKSVADKIAYVESILSGLKEQSPDIKLNRKVVLRYPSFDEYAIALVIDGGDTAIPYCNASIFGKKL